MKQLLTNLLPNIEYISPALIIILFFLAIYFAKISKSLVTFCVSLLIIISAAKPIAYQSLFGVKGLQLIYIWWMVTLIVILLSEKRKSLRIREFFSIPVTLLCLVQGIAWLMTFVAGPEHPYYQAGFDKESLFFGYLMSPVQVLLTGWMVMKATESEADYHIIEKSFLFSSIIFGGLITLIYLKTGKLSGGPQDLWVGRDAIREITEEVNGVAGICVLFFIYSMRSTAHKTGWLKYGAIVLAILGTLFTLSRMAWVAFVVVTLLMFPKISWKKKLIIVFCLAFCWFQFHTMIWNRIHFGFDKNVNSSDEMIDEVSAGRLSLWKDAWAQVEKNPIMGSGIQTAVIMSDGRIAYHPHSAYLRVLLDMGWLGMLIVVICYTYFFIRASRNKGPLYYSIITLAIMGFVCLEFHIHKQTYLIWMYYGLLRNEKTGVAEDKGIRKGVER